MKLGELYCRCVCQFPCLLIFYRHYKPLQSVTVLSFAGLEGNHPVCFITNCSLQHWDAVCIYVALFENYFGTCYKTCSDIKILWRKKNISCTTHFMVTEALRNSFVLVAMVIFLKNVCCRFTCLKGNCELVGEEFRMIRDQYHLKYTVWSIVDRTWLNKKKKTVLHRLHRFGYWLPFIL